ncbi:MAG: hypothetical protein GX542_02445, partial [Rhodococcus sp.]|nr:hypothetical protein [Rhodococcus sp. (in: high G+C Gram-positive bacteria)]
MNLKKPLLALLAGATALSAVSCGQKNDDDTVETVSSVEERRPVAWEPCAGFPRELMDQIGRHDQEPISRGTETPYKVLTCSYDWREPNFGVSVMVS